MEKWTKFKNQKFVSHLNMEDEGQRADSFEVVCKGHIKNGSTIIRLVVTPKTGFMEWGTPVVYFQHDGGKWYKTINGLLKSLGLPKTKIIKS